MRVLVTGAAGYIGSVVTEQLVENGHKVVAVDDLRHGHRLAVHRGAQFVQLDLVDRESVQSLFASTPPLDAVVHLAAEALIDESVRNPGRFFQVNVTGGLNLLDAMAAHGVGRLVFSSTAAVYGEPAEVPIPETAACAPVNSYGESKLAFERMLSWYRRSHAIEAIVLRYFNACGATERHGEFHVPETHLIPLLFDVALGRRDTICLFGTDYETRDGTCVRDYIHVSDIAHAHLLALAQIDRLGSAVFNMGNGAGYSNLEIIECVRRVTGHPIPTHSGPRRLGDPARLVASAQKIRDALGWTPRRHDLSTMIDTAWAWRRAHPQGYSS